MVFFWSKFSNSIIKNQTQSVFVFCNLFAMMVAYINEDEALYYLTRRLWSGG